MPFAGEIGAIALRAQQFGYGYDAVVEVRFIARLAAVRRRDCLGHVAKAGTVADHPGLQHRARG